jgi:predicted ATPase
MGYPQQSLAQNEAAMTAARLKPHHYNLALAHYFTARLHQFRREPDAALIQAEAALALCQEHDIAYFGASSMIVQGWAFAMQHQYQQGIALMQQGWTAIRAMQGKVWGAFLLACQTEGHLANGRFEPAWNTLTDVFRFRQDTEDCCWDGELQRLKGQLLLVRPGDSESDAENCLQQASFKERIPDRTNPLNFDSSTRRRRHVGKVDNAAGIAGSVDVADVLTGDVEAELLRLKRPRGHGQTVEETRHRSYPLVSTARRA